MCQERGYIPVAPNAPRHHSKKMEQREYGLYVGGEGEKCGTAAGQGRAGQRFLDRIGAVGRYYYYGSPGNVFRLTPSGLALVLVLVLCKAMECHLQNLHNIYIHYIRVYYISSTLYIRVYA